MTARTLFPKLPPRLFLFRHNLSWLKQGCFIQYLRRHQNGRHDLVRIRRSGGRLKFGFSSSLNFLQVFHENCAVGVSGFTIFCQHGEYDLRQPRWNIGGKSDWSGRRLTDMHHDHGCGRISSKGRVPTNHVKECCAKRINIRAQIHSFIATRLIGTDVMGGAHNRSRNR